MQEYLIIYFFILYNIYIYIFFIYWFIHSYIHIFIFIYSFIHSFIHPYIYIFIFNIFIYLYIYSYIYIYIYILTANFDFLNFILIGIILNYIYGIFVIKERFVTAECILSFYFEQIVPINKSNKRFSIFNKKN